MKNIKNFYQENKKKIEEKIEQEQEKSVAINEFL